MDLHGENVDFVKLLNVKGNVENITPHKIAVVAFIREYGLLKIEGLSLFILFTKIKYFCVNTIVIEQTIAF